MGEIRVPCFKLFEQVVDDLRRSFSTSMLELEGEGQNGRRAQTLRLPLRACALAAVIQLRIPLDEYGGRILFR
jgi:hypothetical protein